MAAEELNVAFPVTFWTIASDKAPDLEPSTLRSQGPSPFGRREDRGYDPIWISNQQVILRATPSTKSFRSDRESIRSVRCSSSTIELPLL